MYGFLDESGSVGVAQNDNDFLVVALVLFQDKEAVGRCSAAMDRLRTRLGKTDTYEFHCSNNASATKAGLLKLLPSLDFQFISIAIRKNDFKKTASYSRMADLLVREISHYCPEVKIEMDSNPTLYAEMRKQLKLNKLHKSKVKQVKSHSSNPVQLADYVANISAKKARQTPASLDWYRPIAKKVLYYTEINN